MSYAASLAAFFDPRSKDSIQRSDKFRFNDTIGAATLWIEAETLHNEPTPLTCNDGEVSSL
jgi:hypothetical protein